MSLISAEMNNEANPEPIDEIEYSSMEIVLSSIYPNNEIRYVVKLIKDGEMENIEFSTKEEAVEFYNNINNVPHRTKG